MANLELRWILDPTMSPEVLDRSDSVRCYTTQFVLHLSTLLRESEERSGRTAEDQINVQAWIFLLEEVPSSNDTGRRIDQSAIHVEQAKLSYEVELGI